MTNVIHGNLGHIFIFHSSHFWLYPQDIFIFFFILFDSLDEPASLWVAGTETAWLGGLVSQPGETRELQQELEVTECLYERDD